MKKLTPMAAQYMDIKSQYQDSILLFRLGDFYEMFYEDALKASKILQIALTRRNKSDPDQIMCGIPFHAADNYIAKLTRAGEKVAICEQLSKPDGKGIVKRDVVRVITPGTTFDENILDNKANNFVVSIVKSSKSFAFAYCDISTGDFFCSFFSEFKDFKEAILRVNPKECIMSSELMNSDFFQNNLFKDMDSYIFPHDFNTDFEAYLKEQFKVFSLSVFDIEGNMEAIQASSLLYNYLKETQKSELSHIRKIVLKKDSGFLNINEKTIRNLEIFGEKGASLFSILDNCKTAMGSRKLRNTLIYPLCESDEINKRLSIVESYFDDSDFLRNTQTLLSGISDIERLIGKIGIGSANARDVLALKNSIAKFPSLNQINEGIEIFRLDELNSLFELLDFAISDDAPLGLREGGFIKDGYNTELDEIRKLLFEGKDYILKMQEREIKRTGINNLKVKFNKVFGYYIEISNGNLKNVPVDYMRKQTLVNAERFITPELKEYEEKVLKASERINELEFELFHEIRMKILENIKEIQLNAKIISKIDLLSCFAYNARKNNYVKPLIDDGFDIEIINGRHPIVEELIGINNFVPNDLKFNRESGFFLITGPNMGGKSTYLRQSAIIVLMAQVGSFVPASYAKIGVVDKIFSRVGAHDNMAKGESTFMVEMQETSYILNNASERSLIILDEIGRGTSTYDGLSIAWAVCEYLCDKVKAKTLFATHYHELTDLIDSISFAKNFSVKVVEKDDRSIVFLYKIIEGAINRSYGIEVAKLSGLPAQVTARAYEVLKDLEKKKIKRNLDNMDLTNQLSIFGGEREKEGGIKSLKMESLIKSE